MSIHLRYTGGFRLSGSVGLDTRDDPDANDYMLSSLRHLVETMGGRLEVTAIFPGLGLDADVSGEGPMWHRDYVTEGLLQRLMAESDRLRPRRRRTSRMPLASGRMKVLLVRSTLALH